MAFLKLALLALVAAAVAKADYNDDVDYAITVLQDLPYDLATDFCRDYTGSYGGGATSTVTSAATTLTSTVPCGGPWVSTVSSTKTLTFTTTLTTYVPATTPAAYKQRRTFTPNSAAFCPEYGVPCRLVQYDEPVVIQACTEFLSYSDAVTTVTVGTVTVTVPAATCAATGRYSDTPVPSPYEGGDDYGYDGEDGGELPGGDDDEGGELPGGDDDEGGELPSGDDIDLDFMDEYGGSSDYS